MADKPSPHYPHHASDYFLDLIKEHFPPDLAEKWGICLQLKNG
jgi:hypothetical protein